MRILSVCYDNASVFRDVFGDWEFLSSDYAGKFHGLYCYASEEFQVLELSQKDLLDALHTFAQKVKNEIGAHQAYVASSREAMDGTITVAIYVHNEDVDDIITQQANHLFAEAIGRA